MYINRHAEETIRKLAQMFGAVLVTGPRQVGKTTMLQNLLGDIRYVSMDDAVLRASAAESSGTFLKDNPPPVFIDEVQKAPGLFEPIKLNLDSSHKKGQFYLSGSQQFKMMKNVSESLSGRIGVLNLLGLSMRERSGIQNTAPFLPDESYLDARRLDHSPILYDDFWQIVWRGSMPELSTHPEYDWQMYYGAYVTTYIERDVKELTNVGDEVKFTRFLSAMAARTGQLVNLQSVANELGISQPTADRWLSILTASHIVYLLKPYSNNLTSRAVKTPKLYFLDTGLAAYLTRWTSPGVLKNGAMAGAFFESFVVSEVLKSYYNRGILDAPLYFYRDKDQKEIDLLIEDNDTLYPLEIKKHVDPSQKDIAHFDVLDKLSSVKRGPGGVICLYNRCVSLSKEDRVIPVSFL